MSPRVVRFFRPEFLIAALCAVLFWVGPAAAAWSLETVPNVQLADRKNVVSNPDGILSPEAVGNINTLARELRAKTGIELAVAALGDIGDNDPREFATELFNRWGLGQKGKDNGLLILLVTRAPQRAVVFETGYGLEGVLPDAICYRLQQRYMVPDLAEGRYSEGMARGVAAVQEYLLANSERRAEMAAPVPQESEEISPLSGLLGLGFLVLLFFLFRRNPAALAVLLALISRGGRGGGGGGSGGGGGWGGGRSGGGGSISRF